MKKIIALTAFALFAFAPVARSEAVAIQELRATDFSSLKEVDPKPQDKQKGKQYRKSKSGPSSGVETISFKEVDPAPQGKLRGIKSGKGKGGPSSGAEEVGFKEVDPKPQDKLKGIKSGKGKGGPSSGADEVGFNPQPDPPGIDKGVAKTTTRMDTPRFSVPSLGGAGGARVR
jgi:hypothetical protein